jgi:glutathione synthase/RimK-type ligase-like ATP-grasp enzyme
MNNFYCIHEGFYEGVQTRIEHLTNACLDKGVKFIDLDSTKINYCNLPILNSSDFLYNVSRGSENLESLLLNSAVTTFYRINPKFIVNNLDTTKYSLVNDKDGVSAPLTVYHGTNDRALLKSYIDFLKGFPIVIKTQGSTLGIGTLIINDLKSLYSLSDYLCSIKEKFIFRQYIEPKEVARLIVIGNEVVASNQKFIDENDFRTNVKNIAPVSKVYSSQIQQLAIKATHSSNFENGGVDIIIDKQNIPYVLEVNMPHDFVTTSKVTKIDVAKVMVEYLIEKANK